MKTAFWVGLTGLFAGIAIFYFTCNGYLAWCSQHPSFANFVLGYGLFTWILFFTQKITMAIAKALDG